MPDLPKPPLERRHKARRATDVPPIAHNWLVTLIVRNPVTVGMTLALLVASLALVLVLSALVGLGDQQDRLSTFQRQTAVNRVANVGQFCRAINSNAATINRQTDYLKGIIINGAKQSRAFEHVFHQLGLPPYKVRLAQAQLQAAGLEKRKIPALDCKKFQRVASLEVKQVPKP